MIKQTTAQGEDFSEYVRLLLRLHELIAGNQCEGDEAEEIRDQMDYPWRHLTPEALALVDGLSGDLYSVGRDREAPTSARDELLKETLNAVGRDDWEHLLTLLREHELELPPESVAFLRGLCWNGLGEPDVAAVFFAEALRVEPDEPKLRFCLLSCLVKADRIAEALPDAEQIARTSTDPLLLLQAAEVFFVRSSEVPDSDSLSLLSQAFETAKRGLERSEELTDDESVQSLRFIACLHMAMGYRQLADLPSARQACTQALQIQPHNVQALLLNELLNPGAEQLNYTSQFHRGLAFQTGTSLFASKILAELN